MKSKILKGLLMFVCSILVSGCVSQAVFDKHVAAYEEQLEESKKTDTLLLCESRNDAYQDMMRSDEPNPTRRDEPTSTRRDACKDEFTVITQGNTAACTSKYQTCLAPVGNGGAALPAAECRACFTTCLSTGAWDDVACPLP